MSDDIVIARRISVGRFLWQKLASLIRLAVVGGIIAICLQSLAIIFSPCHPILELVSHFAVHGLILATLCMGWVVFQKGTPRWLTVGGLLGMGYLLWLVQPWAFVGIPRSAVVRNFQESITVLSWNVLTTNQAYEEIESIIRKANADVVVLIETPPGFVEHLSGLEESYPISGRFLEWGGNGICVFSRIAGTEIREEPFGYAHQSAMIATIPHRLQTLPDVPAMHLVGLHALSPLPTHRAAIRDQQLDALVNWALKQPRFSIMRAVTKAFRTSSFFRNFLRFHNHLPPHRREKTYLSTPEL